MLHPLSEKEKSIGRLIILSFRVNYNRADRKITSDAIVEKLSLRKNPIHTNGVTLRKIIGYIRRNNLCAPGFILSDNEGYWYSELKDEWKAVWDSQYQRALEIMTNFKPLHDLFKTDKDQLKFEFENIDNEFNVPVSTEVC